MMVVGLFGVCDADNAILLDVRVMLFVGVW